ncbi:MAG TPA: carbamoyl phosphate synthase large subunit, partial [Thermoleophilia bacterium]|nr:carbamoyl phosphate synthase large subunit [Thermoleophilia bacterium]
DPDKSAATILGQRLHALDFTILATRGTARALQSLGVPTIEVNKVTEGTPHVVDLISEGRVDFVVNTPFGRGARSDGYEIRRAALEKGVPCITTLAGASAAVSAIEAARRPRVTVHCLQDLHANGED